MDTTETAPVKHKGGRPPKVTSEVSATAPAYPKIDVLERRLRDPHAQRLAVIDLREQPEPMRTRWGNCQEDGRFSELDAKGWAPVRWEELKNARSIGGARKSEDGYVVRGERGTELLWKIPAQWYDKIKRAEADQRRRNTQSATKQKDQVVGALSQKFGDEAASTVDKWTGGITTTEERVGGDEELP